MFYDAELQFIQQFMKNIHIHCVIETSHTLPNAQMDLGLREMLGLGYAYHSYSNMLGDTLHGNCIYRIEDEFYCNYYFLQLPDTPIITYLIIGPFLTREIKQPTLLKLCEDLSLAPQFLSTFEKYFSAIPLLADDTLLLTLLHTFAEKIWDGATHFTMEVLSNETTTEYFTSATTTTTPDNIDDSFSMQALEHRYAVENDFLQAVTQGNVHKAEMSVNGLSGSHMEQRTTDSLRNTKNYTIIMNTLLRKAAEKGSVHPLHLDRISSDYARKIEMLTSQEACYRLQKEMVRKYCLLVKNHSMKNYSLLIQKAITRIDSDLTADLSLKTIAALLNVNPSYLSNQFKKETGNTLTDYVNKKKVEHAILLLNSTPLQIQTIAQHCGIPDVNYFTKLFKKYIQKTPKEYRDSIHKG
ncbi:MAG: AraC family transcriptional regulator [Lachnospiraceae bacterium]|nr:AraC family transcriptional regulator [Lachnospiraceae bacterium]